MVGLRVITRGIHKNKKNEQQKIGKMLVDRVKIITTTMMRMLKMIIVKMRITLTMIIDIVIRTIRDPVGTEKIIMMKLDYIRALTDHK